MPRLPPAIHAGGRIRPSNKKGQPFISCGDYGQLRGVDARRKTRPDSGQSLGHWYESDRHQSKAKAQTESYLA